MGGRWDEIRLFLAAAVVDGMVGYANRIAVLCKHRIIANKTVYILSLNIYQ